MPTPEQVRAAVDAYVGSFNRSDRAAFLAAFAADAEQIDPVGTPGRRGRDAIAAWWDGAYAAFDRIELQARETYVSGDEAALVFTAIQHKGGHSQALDGVDVFRVDDAGRIATVRGYPGETRSP